MALAAIRFAICGSDVQYFRACEHYVISYDAVSFLLCLCFRDLVDLRSLSILCYLFRICLNIITEIREVFIFCSLIIGNICFTGRFSQSLRKTVGFEVHGVPSNFTIKVTLASLIYVWGS